MEKKVIPTCDPTILKVHTWIYIYLYIIDGVLFDRYGKKIVFIVFSSIGMEKNVLGSDHFKSSHVDDNLVGSLHP